MQTTASSAYPSSNLEPTMSDTTSLPHKTISAMDFQRLETKIDRMATALEKLVLVEERQSNQAISIIELRAHIETNRVAIEKSTELYRNSVDRVEKKVDQWVNRGIGVWVFAAVLFTFVQFAFKFSMHGG